MSPQSDFGPESECTPPEEWFMELLKLIRSEPVERCGNSVSDHPSTRGRLLWRESEDITD